MTVFTTNIKQKEKTPTNSSEYCIGVYQCVFVNFTVDEQYA